MTRSIHPFGRRLKEAFEDRSHAEIGKMLGVTKSAVTHYVGGRVPKFEILLEISRLTNCNLHWLLTGEGPQTIEGVSSKTNKADGVLVNLPEPLLSRVKEESAKERKEVGEIIVDLVTEAMSERAAFARKVEEALRKRPIDVLVDEVLGENKKRKKK